MAAVDVTDESGRIECAPLERAATRLLDLLGKSDAELSVVVVGDHRMRELNHRWRGKDRPTDVLSFAQDGEGEKEGAPYEAARSLGDVVISADAAMRQARDGGWTLAEELNRLLLHGVLHLLGFDHERGGEEARRMHAEESRLSARLIDEGIPCAREELG